MNNPSPKENYGRSRDLFIFKKTGGDSLVLGGITSDSTRWTRVVSQRAAHVLWLRLYHLLYPEQSNVSGDFAGTASFRALDRPTITTHMEAQQIDGGHLEIVGSVGQVTWRTQLDQSEATRLYEKLEQTLGIGQ